MNEQENDYSPAFLVFCSDVRYLFDISKHFKEDAISLYSQTNACTPSFHLLSSLAIELMPKVLIALNVCLKHNKNYTISQDELINEASLEMNKFGHNLGRLYKGFPDLVKFLGIVKIDECPPKENTNEQDYFVWQYNFKFADYIYPIMIKNIEAIRYGPFAKKPDVATICIDDDKIIDFLEKLENYVKEEMNKTKMLLNK